MLGITAGLKVKYNNVFGYFIEVTKTHLSKIPENYQRRQTLVGAERFVTEELKKLESAILSAKSRQVELERELFVELRRGVSAEASRIQSTSAFLAQLDVFSSFASLARAHNYTKPKMLPASECRISIRSGRHPVVERVIGAHNFLPQ